MATLRSILKDKYRERVEFITQQLVGGRAANHAEYRYIVGYLRGMYDLWEDFEPLLQRDEQAEIEGDEIE